MPLRIVVDDVPTVLARFALLLSRRDLELTHLSVHRLDAPGIAVLLVELEATAAPLDDLCRRLSKLVNVLEVTVLEEWAQRTAETAALCDLHQAQA